MKHLRVNPVGQIKDMAKGLPSGRVIPRMPY